ncbi:MAG TPA: type IV secretion system protein [Steroidobacteraceae bacterium]|jgi:type IV secretion system protein VirB5|nr:type IV secretion system protein [Steroidobacteraceae bacterium]
MRSTKVRMAAAFCIASFAVAPASWAQWAVVDAPAIVQLIQEVQTTAQQLQTAKAQLLQAQQALQTMTGARGMEQLLSGSVRNYLPSNWMQVTAALRGSAGFSVLSGDVQTLVSANAVLSPQRLATLSPGAQQLIQDSRQWSAMQQALSNQALSNASNRFAAIQSLIAAIPSASDQKSILDLQARISAELGMLQNEQTKLQSLYQSAQAQEYLLRQQAWEQIVDGHGRFSARFQPVP